MGRVVFVDTSAWVSYFAEREQFHDEAVAAFEELAKEQSDLVTSDYVIAEVVTLLRRRAGLEEADKVWRLLERGELADLVEVGPEHREAARRVFRKFGQLPLSLVDCVSFALMNELGVDTAVTFDGDFVKAGWNVLPGGGAKKRR